VSEQGRVNRWTVTLITMLYFYIAQAFVFRIFLPEFSKAARVPLIMYILVGLGTIYTGISLVQGRAYAKWLVLHSIGALAVTFFYVILFELLNFA